ncbi:MAG TPA: hypothetical protein VD794_08360 [Flavisolibacter sp.]|nr:hypothetical protein [Flavisolibacter sp.]
MAKQAGPIFFVGTIDDLVFYKLGDQYYVRRKSEPTAGVKKRLKRKDVYPVMHMRRDEFGRASRLAKAVYRTLPRRKRKHGLYGKLTGRAVKLLRHGMMPEAVKRLLLDWLYGGAPSEPQTQGSIIPDIKRNKEEVSSRSCLSNIDLNRLDTSALTYQPDHLQTKRSMNDKELITSTAFYQQHRYSTEGKFQFDGS